MEDRASLEPESEVNSCPRIPRRALVKKSFNVLVVACPWCLKAPTPP